MLYFLMPHYYKSGSDTDDSFYHLDDSPLTAPQLNTALTLQL